MMDALAYFLYNLALIVGFPWVILYYFIRLWRRGHHLRGLAERLGSVPSLPPAGREGRLWLHAVSVGEVGVAAVLLPAIRKKRPGLRLALSTVTETGRSEAEKLADVEALFYFPFDFPVAVRRALDRVRPTVLAVVETELWPNLIREASGRGIPVVVVNGRLSDRSFRRYRRLRPLFGPVVGRLAGVAARGAADAARFRALGASGVVEAGNIKYDAPLPPGASAPGRAEYGLADFDPVIVAGSTHAGEEAALARAVRSLRGRFPRVGLLVAPRHLERLGEAEEALRGEGLNPSRWSRPGGTGGLAHPEGVVLLDAMGILADAYACATVAFIGGSLIPHGGQNPIEAARWGVPVVFGPHMENFAEMAEDLLAAGGAARAEVPDALEEALHPWLADRDARDRAGAAARRVVEANRGAVSRVADFLAEELSRPEDRGR